MIKKNLHILLVAAVLIFVGCKKIEPPIDPADANDPIYKLSGLINGDSLNLVVNDTSVFINAGPYVMNGVEGYSSVISDLENDFELKLVVLESEVYFNQDGIQVLSDKNLDFIVHEPSCVGFNFHSVNGQSSQIKVNINNTNFLSSEIILKEYGIYDATINFPNINDNNYVLPIPFGFKNELVVPTFSVNQSDNFVQFVADDHNLDHEWFVDNVLMSKAYSLEQNMGNGLHLVKHNIKDEYGNIASDCAFVFYSDNEFQWFLTKETCDNYQNYSNFGNVFIEVNNKGKTYTSIYNLDNKTKNVKVSNVEYVFSSASVLDYIKFNLAFDADLEHTTSTEKMLLRDFKGTFNVKIE